MSTKLSRQRGASIIFVIYVMLVVERDREKEKKRIERENISRLLFVKTLEQVYAEVFLSS